MADGGLDTPFLQHYTDSGVAIEGYDRFSSSARRSMVSTPGSTTSPPPGAKLQHFTESGIAKDAYQSEFDELRGRIVRLEAQLEQSQERLRRSWPRWAMAAAFALGFATSLCIFPSLRNFLLAKQSTPSI